MLNSEGKQLKIPQRLLCSITGQILSDPVITSDGHTYEREAIEAWLKTHTTSPKTGEVLQDKKLTPNWDKKSDVSDFLSEYPEAYEELYLSLQLRTALVEAIKGGKTSAVKELLDRDPRLLLTVLENDYTAFHLSAAYGSAALTAFLIERLQLKALVNQLPCAPKGFKGPYLNQLLEEALRAEDLERGTLLVQLGADKVQAEEDTGNTLLHRLTLQGKPRSVGYLLDQGIALEAKNTAGNTPLLLAILSDNAVLVDFLLRRKAKSEPKNEAGESAIIVAVLRQNKAILALLLPPGIASLPPLHIALALKNEALLKRLLSQEGVLLESLDPQKRTPFYVAVEKGDTVAALALLERGAKFKQRAPEGLSPLHLAAAQGNVPILSALLKRGMEVDVRNTQEETPLHVAAKAGQDAVIPLLLEAGANRKAKNRQHQTPMELAIAEKHPQSFALIENTAYALKQARLEENRALKILVKKQAEQLAEQSRQIEVLKPLKQEIEALRKELSLQLGKEKEARLASEEALHQKILTFRRPASPPPRPSAPTELPVFLRLVAEGEQAQAEAMLQKNRDLVLFPGNVRDLSKRTFENITAFQYAVWALDWHMWTMLRTYLPDEQAAAQLMTTGSWVSTHGLHAGMPGGPLDKLIKAYEKYNSHYDEWSENEQYDLMEAQWCEQIGGAQLLLPAHAINEYCRPDRSFDPCPNFEDNSKLPRTRKVFIDKEYDDVLTATWNGGSLGNSFGLFRGSYTGVVMRIRLDGVWAPDHRSITTLCSTRTQQRDKLITELSNSSTLGASRRTAAGK